MTYCSGVLVVEFLIEPAKICWSWSSLSDDGTMVELTMAADHKMKYLGDGQPRPSSV